MSREVRLFTAEDCCAMRLHACDRVKSKFNFSILQTIEFVSRLIRRVKFRLTLFRFVDEFITVKRMMARLRRILAYFVFMFFFTVSTVYVFQEQVSDAPCGMCANWIPSKSSTH